MIGVDKKQHVQEVPEAVVLLSALVFTEAAFVGAPRVFWQFSLNWIDL